MTEYKLHVLYPKFTEFSAPPKLTKAYVTVEADSPEEALKLARARAHRMTLCSARGESTE